MYFFLYTMYCAYFKNYSRPVLLCTRFLLCIYLQMGVFKHIFKFQCFFVSLSENGRGRWGAANEEIVSESWKNGNSEKPGTFLGRRNGENKNLSTNLNVPKSLGILSGNHLWVLAYVQMICAENSKFSMDCTMPTADFLNCMRVMTFTGQGVTLALST